VDKIKELVSNRKDQRSRPQQKQQSLATVSAEVPESMLEK
jgi:hypothetical protein